jgi:5'-3' exonuclease
VFYQDGYEADDIIASVCDNTPAKDEVVVVSGDKDLLQLLSARVFVWQPTHRQVMTVKSFQDRYYGLHPQHWARVKAIAGCSTDDVPGVKGVGDATAAKFLMGLKTNKADEIEAWLVSNQYRKNLDLVRLPYTGTPDYPPVQDMVDTRRWRKLTTRLGMKSLADLAPRPVEGFGLRKVAIRKATDDE